MKRTIRQVFFALVITGLLIGAGCSESPPGELNLKKEYRMQVTVGPQTYWGMGAARFAELVQQKTAGRITVKPYYGSQLLKGAQLNAAQMVASGGIDLALESTINTAPVIPQMNIFSLPFFINTYENLDKLEEGETGKLIFEKMKQKGLMPLAWGENGFRQLTNSKHPVRKPEDLKGLKIRVVGSPIFIDIFRQLGADPINMNWGDAVTAFQQGTVDGQENPVAILLAVQIYQFQKYATFWNYLVDPLILYWSKKEWDTFPDDIRQAIQEAAIEAGRFEKALCRVGLDDGASLKILRDEFKYDIAVTNPVAVLEEHGMHVRPLSAEEHTAFKEATQPVFDKWVEKLGDEIYQAAQKDMGR